MSTRNDTDVEQHVTILGWLFIVGNALFLVIGVFIFLLVTSVGLATRDVEARSILLIVGPAVGLLLTVLALPGLAAGYGLITRKPWARVLAIVVAILGLPNFPFGTAIGVYALWVLFAARAREYFTVPAGALLVVVPGP
jgi:hypothetical protein